MTSAILAAIPGRMLLGSAVPGDPLVTPAPITGLAVVQSAPAPDTNPSGAVSFTLGLAPVPGNVLFAFCAYSQFAGANTITTPSGWTKIDDWTQSFDSQATFWHVVQQGDGISWSFTVSVASDATSGVMYEVQQANTAAPVNQHNHALIASGGTATTGPSATPSVIGCLALSAVTMDDQTLSVSSVSTGWRNDQAATGHYHGSYGAHRISLTTDTTTAVSNTWTWGSSAAGPGVSEIVLVAPKPASSPLLLSAFP